jgi:hypothetical protein
METELIMPIDKLGPVVDLSAALDRATIALARCQAALDRIRAERRAS